MFGEEETEPRIRSGEILRQRPARLAVPKRVPRRLMPPPGHTPAPGSDLRAFIAILIKHWKAATIFAVVTVAVVALATFLMTPVYEPEGRIQIDPPGEEAFSLQTVNGTPDSEYISTEAAKLETAELARATVQSLGLSHNPDLAGPAALRANEAPATAERAALVHLQAQLKVSRDPGSRLVAVRFASHDPQLSAAVVNRLMKLFVERSYQSRHEAIQQSAVWLSKQLDDIREKMDQSSRAVLDFQRKHGIADTGHDSTTMSQEVGELNKQLAEAQSQRIQLESLIQSPADASLPQISSSPVMQGLTQKRAELSGQLAQAEVIYGPNHPSVRKLQRESDELERQLRMQQSAMKSEMQTSYQAARQREALLQKQVKSATLQLGEMEQYLNLKKQADADRQLYDSLYAKIKESGIAAASKSSNIRVVEEAPVLDHPTRPHRLLNLLLGAVFGILGGLALAFIKEGLEDRIQNTEDIRSFTGLSSVVVVPSVAKNRKPLPSPKFASLAKSWEQPRLLLNEPSSPESEAMNSLRTFVMLSRERRQRVLMVTSPMAGDGKTTVATSLAVSLAKLGPTCLIDADMRRPRIARTLSLSHGPGLESLLRNMAQLGDVMQTVPHVQGLSVIATHRPVESAAELLSGFPMARIIQDLREISEYVVIDSPPVLPFAESRALSTMVDGIILVGRAASTPRIAMTRTVELFEELRSAPVLTVVLNGVDMNSKQYKYYSQY
jgi:polysaccharide biosynthesis transport protein